MLSLAPHSWGCLTGFLQRLVVSRKMAATVSYGCSSVWVTKRCLQCIRSPPLSPAWCLRSEPLIRRDSSFGDMDPKDHWDLGCLRCHLEVHICSQMGPKRGMAPLSRPIIWCILIYMWPCCLACDDISAHRTVKVSKPITSRWPSPGE